MQNEFERLTGTASMVRVLAAQLRAKGLPYEVVRIYFNMHNHDWNGQTGLALKVTQDTYRALFAPPPLADEFADYLKQLHDLSEQGYNDLSYQEQAEIDRDYDEWKREKALYVSAEAERGADA